VLGDVALDEERAAIGLEAGVRWLLGGGADHGGLEGGLRHVMDFDVITIFPEMFEAVSRHGITRRALEEKLFEMKTWDPRDFTTDNYRTIDDRPYGGGPGMVMLAEPLDKAIAACREAA